MKLLVDGFSAWMAQRQAAANAKEVGQLQAINKINAETTEMQDAMNAVTRPSDDAVVDRAHEPPRDRPPLARRRQFDSARWLPASPLLHGRAPLPPKQQ